MVIYPELYQDARSAKHNIQMDNVVKAQLHETVTPEARVQSQASPTVICKHVEKRPLDDDRARGDRPRVGILMKLRQG